MNLLIFKLVNFNKQKKTLLRNTKSNFLEVTLYFPPPTPLRYSCSYVKNKEGGYLREGIFN